MAKQLDLTRSVFELVREYPELVDIMAELGFSEIINAPVLHAVGKIMTIPKGARMKGIPMERILDSFKAHGFEVTGAEASLQREGFAEAVKKHQVLQDNPPQANYADKNARAAALAAIPGHPLNTFTKENEALARLLLDAREKSTRGADIGEELAVLRQLSIHYAKKGDLLYPHLKVKYGISGPSDVMWTVDDEIRDEMGALVKEADHDADWKERVRAVLKRADEMIYKEQNILFPICAVNFTEDEWMGIYRDSKDYAVCFGVENGVWEAAESQQSTRESMVAGEIVMPGGHMTLDQLTALLNTIPVEITFVDADNINRFFNEGPKVFKRPGMAIDREVFSCHPPRIEAMARAIIDDLRAGRRDIVPVWMEKGGRSMLVRYMAVRDAQRNYLGTVEVVEDMELAREHFLGNQA